MPQFSLVRRTGCVLALVAVALSATPAISQATTAPTPREKHAIEHVVLSLYRATESHDWPLACQQYLPKDRHEFVLLARSLGHLLSISDCAQALAAIDRAAHQHPVAPPHFKRITVSGNSAHVRITNSRGTASDTVTLHHDAYGWKVVLEFVIKRLVTT